jgi:hypothetical protein
MSEHNDLKERVFCFRRLVGESRKRAKDIPQADVAIDEAIENLGRAFAFCMVMQVVDPTLILKIARPSLHAAVGSGRIESAPRAPEGTDLSRSAWRHRARVQLTRRPSVNNERAPVRRSI